MSRISSRRQGDLGELSAIEWLGSQGHVVYVPIGHSPDVDLIALEDDAVLRVQARPRPATGISAGKSSSLRGAGTKAGMG
jgi:hypothetical protein